MATRSESSGKPIATQAVLDLYAVPVRDLPVEVQRAEIETAPCIVCGQSTARPRYDLVGLDYRVIDCTGCGTGSLDPLPSPSDVASFYPAVYYGRGGSKFSGSIEWLVRLVAARHFQFLTRQLPPGARVLDVGCGRGVALRALARAGFEAHGFERSADAVQGVDPRVQVRIADDLSAADYPEDYFDAVIIWHVLEHVRNPGEVLLEIARILKPGGRIIVAVPNYSSLQSRWAGSAWFHLDLPRHLYHFPVAALHDLLENSGFACRSEHHFSLRQNPFGWIQSVLNRSTRLPRNGLYVLLQRRKGDQRPKFSVATRLKLYAALAVLSGPAVVLAVVAALRRRGATVHIVATEEERTLD
ncbi:MAG: class I SAM-dependent methyltransferase [Planctomycetaceae bacterium]|nr:class I SAM-dependent methyltransferase [Planctomycetaceae bacterium]